MSIPTDDLTRRKLVLVKQLYQQALIHAARRHSLVARVMGVVAFDLAVESVLKTVIGALDPSKTPADSFPGLLQQSEQCLAAATLPPLTQRANIQHVHSIRNDAQHKGKYPGDVEVNDCRTYTRDFLDQLIQNVWALPFEHLSLVDLVQNDEIRAYLLDADAKFQSGDYGGSMNAANSALTWALILVERPIVGGEEHFVQGLQVEESFGKVRTSRKLYEGLTRMRDTLLYVALGLDFADYMRFRGIAGMATPMLDGHWDYHGAKELASEDDAEFVLAYSTNSVLQIEDAVGDLERPFGRDRWF